MLQEKSELKQEAASIDRLKAAIPAALCRNCGGAPVTSIASSSHPSTGEHWTTKCPYKSKTEPATAERPAERPAATTGRFVQVPACSNHSDRLSGGAYVAPGRRGDGKPSSGFDPMRDRDDSATVRVSNLPQETRESDLEVIADTGIQMLALQCCLQSLFSTCGRVVRCRLPKDDAGQAKARFAQISSTGYDLTSY